MDISQIPDDLSLPEHSQDEVCFSLSGKDAHTYCAAIMLSSGTTGSPKAVMLSHHNLVASAQQLRGHNPDNWNGSMREVFFPVCHTITHLSRLLTDEIAT